MLIPINTLSNFPELSFALAGYPEEIVTSFNGWTVGFRPVAETVIQGQIAAEQPFAASHGVSSYHILKGRIFKNRKTSAINLYFHLKYI